MIREARAMAKLSHPHVVAVYDVVLGQSAGVVIAMEYVAGGTLSRWLKVTRPWTEIVAVFMAAGRGLAAAHAKDLLHRDFKPSNVLVTDDGRIRVTDFGLAKLGHYEGSGSSGSSGSGSSSSSSSEFMDLTQANEVVGTPRYMAPEQHARGDLDTRTDQYAFCVALWEALTGASPFRGENFQDYEQVKQRGPPPWPKGNSVPATIRKALTRGLAVDPSQRWATMDELLAELGSTSGRRRRRLVLGLGLSVISGVALTAVSWSAHSSNAEGDRCAGAQAQLSGVWDPRQRQQVEDAMAATRVTYAATTWTRTAARLDAYADAWVQEHVAACEVSQVRKEQSVAAMDLRMGCLHRAKVELSAVAEQLSQVDDETMKHVHRMIDNLPKLVRCSDVEMLEAELPPPDGEAAAAAEWLRVELAQAKAKNDAGHYDEAVEQLEGLESHVDAVGGGPLEAEILLQLGKALQNAGHYDRAAITLERALLLGLSWRQWGLARDTASMLMFVVGYLRGRAGEGLAYKEVAWGLLAQAPDEYAEARMRNTLGIVLEAQGKYEEAEAEHRAALSLRLEQLGPGHPVVANSRNNLGVVLEAQGKHEEAEAEHRAALSSRLEQLGPSHPEVANSRNNLGVVLEAQGKHEEAEAEHRAALSSRLEQLGPSHPEVASSRNNLGVVLEAQGKYEEAEAEYRAALSLLREQLGPSHPKVASSRNNLGVALWKQGKYEEAEAEYRAALSLVRAQLGPDHPRLARLRSNLGVVLAAQGKLEQAEAEHRGALWLRREQLGPSHPEVANSRTSLARVLLRRGESLGEALEHAEAAWSRHGEPDIPPKKRAATAFLLARLLWARPSERQRAVMLAQTARDAYTQAGSTFDQDRAEVEAWLRMHR